MNLVLTVWEQDNYLEHISISRLVVREGQYRVVILLHDRAQ